MGGSGLAAIWAARSEAVGRVARALPLTWLIGVQSMRMIGGVLLVLHAQGQVPTYFAMTVGGGDVLAGVLAPFVALWAARRGAGWFRVVLIWQTYALVDLCHSAVAATLSADTPVQLLPGLQMVVGELPVVTLVVYLVPVAFLWCVVTLRHLRALHDA